MKKRNDSWYDSDKGKHFVLTEKGKKEVASYHHKTVGEPVSEYDTEAVWWAVESEYVIEVDIPNWVVRPGFEVVYDYKGHTLSAGNPMVFPEREMAEKYMANYSSRHLDEHLYIRDAVYEGVELDECRFHDGKRVHNGSWIISIYVLMPGDLVEQEVIDTYMDMIMPACMRSDCFQIGTAANHVSENGKWRATHATFKRVDCDTWEYCGECFRGENEPPQ